MDLIARIKQKATKGDRTVADKGVRMRLSLLSSVSTTDAFLFRNGRMFDV